jgi:type IV secretion system protein VirB1
METLIIIAASATFALGALAPTAAKAAVSASVLDLAKQCAPNVHPLTMAYLVAHESHNNRLAINVNGNYHLPKQPETEIEAADAVRWLDAHAMNFDVGYAQINSANFARLGKSGEDLLSPCENLRASAAVLTDCYARAVRTLGEGQNALRHALSCYNTGSQTRGFANGYVSKVIAQVRLLQIPALLDDSGGTAIEAQPLPSADNGTKSDDNGKSNGASLASAPDPRHDSDAGAFSTHDPGAFGAAKPEFP